jgi:pyrroline-5-carboxylate reductase
VSRIVFLGGGRITAALLAGLRLAKSRDHFVVHDRHPAKMRRLQKEYGVALQPDLERAVSKADLLVVAVRPDSVGNLLFEIGSVGHPLLAVSLAAGVPLRLFASELGPTVRWARAMPSPTCRTGRGLTGLTFPQNLPRSDRDRVRRFFANVGMVVEIPENKFDAFTVTYSASHGYHALEVLAAAGCRAGLDRKTALLAASHALSDSIAAWREGEHSLESLLHEAATPGGIAATTMAGMNAAGYKRAVLKGVDAGLRRARANAKKFRLVRNR